MPIVVKIGNAIGWAGNPVGSGGGYTPADDPDLFDWWDAQSGVSESGGELTAWLGSANSETANPPTVTARPLYGNTQINSLDVLTFRESDPNYLEIDATTLGSGVCIMIILNSTSDFDIVFGSNSDDQTYIISVDGNSASSDRNGNLGGNINYYENGVLIGNDITRGQLYTAINNNNILLTCTNVDLSAVDTLRIGARSDLGSPFDGQIADIVISTSAANQTENETFLIDKYGF